jgi:hypothetical protein
MARTEIEVYETLKKDMSEDSARLIAERFTGTGDLPTRDEVGAIVRAEVSAAVSAAEARLKAYIDSRLLRYTAIILVPVSLTMLGTVGALIALVIKAH